MSVKRLRANNQFSSQRISMSKLHKVFLFFFVIPVQILYLFDTSQAQAIEATITIESIKDAVAIVQGRYSDTESNLNRRNFSILRSSAGIENLADRISEVKLTGKNEGPIEHKRFIPGEYVADADFDAWSYKFALRAPKVARAAASVLSKLPPVIRPLTIHALLGSEPETRGISMLNVRSPTAHN